MKRLLIAAALALALVGVAGQAHALSFSVDVPILFTPAEKHLDTSKNLKAKGSSNDVSGFILGASAGWFGVGYERYVVGLDAESEDSGSNPQFDVTSTYQFYDIFLDLPFPVIHPVIGYGLGTVSSTIEGADKHFSSKSVAASQYFVRLGMALGPLFDLHLGYHDVKTDDGKVSNNAGTKVKNSGELWTLGVRLGW